MKQIILLSIALVSSLQLSLAHAGQGLLDIYEKAVDKDPVLAGAEYAAIAGKEKSSQGRALLLPKINVSANVSYQYSKDEYNSPLFPDRSKKSDSRNVALQATQTIFNLADFKSYSQSKLISQQSDIQLRLAEQDLILRVSQAYFDVLSANENLQVANAQTKAFKESLERAKLTFKVGTSTRTDKLEAQARYDLARASEISANNQLAIAKQALASIIGEVPEQLKQLKENAKLVKLKANDIQHWVDLALESNLQLQLVNSGFDISNIEVQKLKSDRYPVLSLVANASNTKQYLSFTNQNAFYTKASVGLQVSMPIYTGGLITSRIKEAENLKFQQQQNKINTQRQVILQTQQAYLNSYNGLQQVNALKQAMESSSSALEATEKGVEVGVRTNLDLLDSQQQLFSTERDYNVAKYNYLLSLLNLKAAAGTLSKDDIAGMDALLK